LRKHSQAAFSEIAFSSEKIMSALPDKRQSIDYKEYNGAASLGGRGKRSRAIDLSKSNCLVSHGVPDEGKVEEVGVRDGA